MDNLQTGDLLLFTGHNTGWFKYLSKMIQYGTHSDFSHIGFVLKDPTYINPNLKGIYVWESGWEGKPDPQDSKVKLGVQITPINEIITNFKGCKIIKRNLKYNINPFNSKTLLEIHDVVYNKPYDIFPKDWVEALLRKDSVPQKTDRFWCSALVGYIYTKCGILNENTDWSILRPSDFSLSGENLNYNEGYYLENKETRIL